MFLILYALATIEQQHLDKRWYQKFSGNYNTIDDCLVAFDNL